VENPCCSKVPNIGLTWHYCKTPPQIEATAALIQATCADPSRSPFCEQVKPFFLPDFPSLSEAEKIREYQIIEEEIDTFGNWGRPYPPVNSSTFLLPVTWGT
jgi:hypothetical protein